MSNQSVALVRGCPQLGAPEDNKGAWELVTPGRAGSTSSPDAPDPQSIKREVTA